MLSSVWINNKINKTVIKNTNLKEIKGDKNSVTSVVLDKIHKGSRELNLDGVFVAIGHIPATEMFKKTLELDERGYIVRMPTDYQGEVEEKKHFHTKTSISGVFVAGDVHDHVYRQAITAAGFGCMAGMDALRYLDKQAPSW